MMLYRNWLLRPEWEQASVIAGAGVLALSLAAVLVSRLLRRSPAIRDTLLGSALAACLLIPVVAASVVAIGGPLISLSVTATPEPEPELRTENLPAMSPLDAPSAMAESREDSISWMRTPPTEQSAEVNNSRRLSPASAAASPSTAGLAAAATEMSVSAVLLLTWLAGVFLMLGCTLRSLRQVRRIRRRAKRSTLPRRLAIAEAAAAAVGLPRRPNVVESADVVTPAVIGWLSPAVVLPETVVESLSDDNLHDVFLHEFAHIRRRDQWILLAQALARCLYWPVLSIHWLNRELGRSREEVCDNVVLAHRDAIEYGELLLRLAQFGTRSRPVAATVGILNWEGELEGRVVRLLDPRTSRSTGTSRGARLALLAGFLLMACVLCGTRFVAAQQRPGPKAPAEGGPKPAPAQEPGPKPAIDALGDPLPERALLRLGTSRFHPPSSVPDLALSPDESVIVTIGDQLIVWDASTGKERWRANAADFGCDFHGAAYGARAVTFASGSAEFFTPGRGNSAIVWEANSGNHDIITISTPPKGRQAGQGVARSIDVTPDGKTLAIGRTEGLVVCDREGNVLFEVANEAGGQLKFDQEDRLAMFGHSSLARFSPDGKILAVVNSDRPEELRLFDVKTGAERRQIPLTAKLVRMAFSPDGKRIAATERDSAVRLYEVDSGKRVWSQVVELKDPFENYTSAVAYSPDGKIIAAGATDHRLYLLDSSSGEQVGHLTGHAWYPWTLAFTADSQRLYSSGWDGAIRRWDVAARKQLPLPAGIRASGTVAASPDGRRLAYVDDAGTIRLVDAETGVELSTIQIPGSAYDHLKFSPDGRHLAGGGSNGDQVHVAVWNVADRALLHRWDWPKGRDPHSTAESLCFSPDGTRLAAEVFRQSSAYVWDLTSGKQTVKLAHQEIYGLSFSPDGKTLATAGWDSAVRFWHPDTGERLKDVAFPKEQGRGDLRMYAVCYAPEGGLLATAHLDGSVRVWQVESMQLRSEFHVDGRFIYGAISFSPDGLWLATGSANGHVELWDPQTGSKVLEVGSHQGYVYTVSFGRDNRTLVSGGSQEDLCYLWDLRPIEKPPAMNEARLWDELALADGPEAYQAIWALADLRDKSVVLAAEKLRRVTELADADWIIQGLSPEEAQRIEKLKRRLAGGDPAVARSLTVRRAAALLAQIGTADAKRLLEDLAKRDPTSDLGRIAAGALNRMRVSK